MDEVGLGKETWRPVEVRCHQRFQAALVSN